MMRTAPVLRPTVSHMEAWLEEHLADDHDSNGDRAQLLFTEDEIACNLED